MRAAWEGHLYFYTFKIAIKLYPAIRKQNERKAVIWVKDQLLALSTIRRFDEQTPEQVLCDKFVDIHFHQSEMQQTVQLIRRNLSHFDKQAGEDRFREKLIDLLVEKIVREASGYELAFPKEA